MNEKHLLHRICVAVENEPFPKGPAGESARIKLRAWLELSDALKANLALDIVPLNELHSRRVDIVETFSTGLHALTKETFPSIEEHHLVNFLPNYWSAVIRSGVPAIPVIDGEPDKFPVFVRGELGTFKGGGRISTRAALARLQSTGRRIIVRPLVMIRRAGTRKEVTLELRAHIVCGKTVTVEYLFPSWAAQKPTSAELEAGHSWTESVAFEVVKFGEEIAAQLSCRWFVADFAATTEGLRLIELNPGWCSGIAHAEAARAVHLAILRAAFGVQVPSALFPKPAAGVPFVRNSP